MTTQWRPVPTRKWKVDIRLKRYGYAVEVKGPWSATVGQQARDNARKRAIEQATGVRIVTIRALSPPERTVALADAFADDLARGRPRLFYHDPSPKTFINKPALNPNSPPVETPMLTNTLTTRPLLERIVARRSALKPHPNAHTSGPLGVGREAFEELRAVRERLNGLRVGAPARAILAYRAARLERFLEKEPVALNPPKTPTQPPKNDSTGGNP